MTHFKRILTLLFVMICLAASTTQADTCEPNGNPNKGEQGTGILRPRRFGNSISFYIEGRHLIFCLNDVTETMHVTCRNMQSGEMKITTITADSPELILPSGGAWEIDAVYAKQHYYGKVDIKELAQF